MKLTEEEKVFLRDSIKKNLVDRFWTGYLNDTTGLDDLKIVISLSEKNELGDDFIKKLKSGL